MRNIIVSVIRKRNPDFNWPASLPFSFFTSFVYTQVLNLLRGSRLVFFGRNPKMMLRGKGVRILGLRAFKWGRYLKLGDYVHINAMGTDGIILGQSVGLGAYSRLIVSGSLSDPGKGITLGDNVGIGEFAYLGGAGGLTIGDDCIVGQYFSCHPENHRYENANVPVRLQGVTRKGIVIGTNCWIGSKVTVLDGVTIGDNCIIAAGAVVNRSFPANSVIAGVPARVVKTITGEAGAHINPRELQQIIGAA